MEAPFSPVNPIHPSMPIHVTLSPPSHGRKRPSRRSSISEGGDRAHKKVKLNPQHMSNATPHQTVNGLSTALPRTSDAVDQLVEDGKTPVTAFVVDDSGIDEWQFTLDDPLFLMNYHPLPSVMDDDSWYTTSEFDARLEQAKVSLLADAWLAVEQLSDLAMRLSAKVPNFLRLVHMNDIVAMMERLLDTKQRFLEQGKPSLIDIGFHYTVPDNLERIQTDGLLSKSERDQRGIVSNFNGTVYGDGIYTGSNPGDHYGKYGNVGLVVLRLKGRVDTHRYGGDHDTTVDRLPPMDRIVVLKNSVQCVPIFQYDASQLKRHDPTCRAAEVLAELHQALESIVDSSINSNAPERQAPVALPPIHRIQSNCGVPPARFGKIRYFALTQAGQETITPSMYTAISPYLHGVNCPVFVCRFKLGHSSRRTIRLKKCGHLIHLKCLEKAQCPVCMETLDSSTPLGPMPSGFMEVSRDSLLTCPGHIWGTLIIKYTFPSGTQSDYHPNPGYAYGNTERTAYLPDTKEGRALLSRLQDAFLHGLTFAIGTSQTTGKPNSIVWNGIPHKSAINGGPWAFGYPDEHYFSTCHAALDILSVRPASSDDILQEDDP
eukprot:scaffold2992_cov214-Amphora_coffeaeformis.AAC.23